MKLYNKIFLPQILELENGKNIQEPRSKFPLIFMMLFVFIMVSAQITNSSLSQLWIRGEQFLVIIDQMFPPKWSYIQQVWTPLLDTIKMSLLGSVIGSLAAIPFSILASGNIVRNKIILLVTRLFLSLARTLPTLVTALIATYMFGLGTLAGTCAIAVFTFSYVGKQLYELIETVDMGAYEAVEALGVSKPKSFISAIIPQVLPAYLSNCLFCFEGNVRYAAILGYVGAGGLGLILNEKIGWREYSSVGMILTVLFITVAIIELVSHYLRTKLT